MGELNVQRLVGKLKEALQALDGSTTELQEVCERTTPEVADRVDGSSSPPAWP